MAPDKFQTPPQPPPVFIDTAESIADKAKKYTQTTKSVLDKVVADVQAENATFGNVLEPVLIDENQAGVDSTILGFYQYVSPHASLREASSKAEEVINEFGIESKMRGDVFKVVDAAYNTRASQSLDPEALHILEKERQKYIRNGLLIPAGPKRDRFMETQKRMSQLCIQGNKNLNEENGGIWFTPEEIDGIPTDDVDVSSLEKGTGENEGKVKLTFKYNHHFALMKYAKNENTRRRYAVAETNKVNDNVPIFQEVVELRDEAARLLGYPNHASVRIEEKMAKKASNVDEFLGDLRSRLTEGGKRELAELLAYKKRDYEERGVPFDGKFYMWDTAFYTRMIKEKEYNVNEVAISQYFPIQPTFNGMLKIFEEIFGLHFVELDAADKARLSPTGKGEDITWHEDVIVYTVWNEEAFGGDFCGYLYIDMHPRDNKYGHNANFELQPSFIKEDGSRHRTATALVCNFSKPSPTKPSLLKHFEFVTMFHELGHGIHGLVSRTRYSYTSGTSVAWDFVEAPSQMLENWCWTPSVLKRLSGHWENNAQIPDDLIEKLIKTKNFNLATFNLRQLLIGIFDMTVHSAESPEAIKALKAGELWNKLRLDITGIMGPEELGEGHSWGNPHAGVGHFIGGYDAGYYGYLYSHVFSTDMFYSHFKKDPMNKEEGRRYRSTVLARGGSIDEMEFLKEFLGREPSTRPFYEELGLSN